MDKHKSGNEKGFFRSLQRHLSVDKGLKNAPTVSTPTSSSTEAPHSKNNSFSGHLPFSKEKSSPSEDPNQSGILSRRPSLMIPFAPNSTPATHDGDWHNYLEDFQAPTSKSGVLVKQGNHLKTWKKRLMVLKGHSLFYYVSGSSGEDSYPRGVIPLLNVQITPIDAARFKRQNCFELLHQGYRPIYLMAKSEAALSDWMSALTSASVPTTPDRRELETSETLEALFATPSLEETLPYLRPLYFRKKLAFTLPRTSDKSLARTDRFELDEKRLTVLSEINTYCESTPSVLQDPQLYMELLHVVGCYIFRPFNFVRSSSPGNIYVEEPTPDELGAMNSTLGPNNEDLSNPLDTSSDYTLDEQHWSLLSACYDLLLRAIEHIDKLEKPVRKQFYSTRFIAQLVDLFQTPSFRERQVLKGVLHRLYYKLTQRRSAIRREIANTFYAYIYENSPHYGVAELLEILGSIVNGFACPIKQEHITLLTKALIPLHSVPAFVSYHQQLAYCMIQYVGKDHALFNAVAKGLLKYWPVGSSFKEVIFLVELEELLEHVLSESDFDGLGVRLSRRLGKCVVSDQFQVSERALAVWNSAACLRIMNEYEILGQTMFNGLKPFLNEARKGHWNALIQQKAQETYLVYYNMGYDNGEEEEEERDRVGSLDNTSEVGQMKVDEEDVEGGMEDQMLRLSTNGGSLGGTQLDVVLSDEDSEEARE